ncbi:hypothetical protein R1sor_000623 [Riccia sorocarpa]|uniref:DDE Tnp4 domain-containing protein n=1 Tax=Riccia sorocarpa TaxID=122646 RepID=A0ABD3GXU3_9MARC
MKGSLEAEEEMEEDVKEVSRNECSCNAANLLQSLRRRRRRRRQTGGVGYEIVRKLAPKVIKEDTVFRLAVTAEAIADPDGAFLDVSCGFPGSVHDRRILGRSRFLEKVEADEILTAYAITVNNGFMLRPYILGDA